MIKALSLQMLAVVGAAGIAEYQGDNKKISTVKCYNRNLYCLLLSDCLDRAPEERGSHMNVRTSARENATSNSINMPDGGKYKAMISAMDIYNYKPSYNGYKFFQPVTTTVDDVTDVTCSSKTCLGEVQGSPVSPRRSW